MKITREQFVNLRKSLITYLPELEDEIEEMAEILIDNPTMIYVESNYRDLKYDIESNSVENGHDCWGKSEWIHYDYVCGVSADYAKCIILDNDERHIKAYRFDFVNLIDRVKQEYKMLAQMDIENFNPL